jgi:hypothetical protein
MRSKRRESGTARLRAALEERTRERVPLDWAMTQNNLGLALQALGERESGTARVPAPARHEEASAHMHKKTVFCPRRSFQI